jgi:hypothetical protein
MTEMFSLTVGAHRVFGALATMRLDGQAERRFTLQEARHVARALDAMATGATSERGVFMSPIASDADFEASATAAGLVVAAPPGGAPLLLGWPQVRALAAALLCAAADEPCGEGALATGRRIV